MRISKPRRTLRDRGYYVHHRERIITKRTKIIKNSSRRSWWNDDYGDRRLTEPGRIAKDNMSCNCWMCKWEKKNGILKPKYKFGRDRFNIW